MFALGSLVLGACGTVTMRNDAGTDGKTGVIIDSGTVGPGDGSANPPPDATQSLCVAPSNPPTTKSYINLFENADGRSGPSTSCPKVGTSYTSSNPQFVFCRTWGSEVRDSNGNYNHWWLWTQLDSPLNAPAWISAYYIQGQGNDQANDLNTGKPIPDCPQ